MKHFLFTLLLALFCFQAYAQSERKDTVIVTGNVLDSFTREYLDSVHVELLQPLSGEVVTFTYIDDWAKRIEDEDERHHMEQWNPVVRRRVYRFKAVPGTYTLRLSLPGYQEKEVELTIPPRRYGRRTETWEVKDVLLDKDRTRQLGEAVVHATKIKMMTKGDTVIYNADAFQLADGSMLDGLIAMMPGLEIRNGSQIYQNGEYIPELLLNGKDFFNGDPAIALKNLPAYTVKDLRIYHKAPDGAYLRKDLTHEDTLRWGKVLDVRLKKQYSHGWITNAELAAGPAFAKGKSVQDVWLARLFGLHFSDHTRLGVFANVNNMNDTGLASSDGSWRSSWTPDPGVTTMKLGALDFTVDGKKTKLNYNLNMQAVQETTDSETETSATSFIPTGDVYSRSRNTNTFDRFHFVWNNTFNWTGKKAYFYFKPGLDFFRRNNDGQSLSAQFNGDPLDAYRGASLDSIFASSSKDGYLAPFSPRLQQMLVNRTSSIYSNREDFWWEVVRLGTSFRSPIWGNGVNINFYQQYRRQTPERSELYDLRTAAAPIPSAPASGLTTFQNRYILTPSRDYYSSLNIDYHFHSFGKFNSYISYEYSKTYSKNSRDYYRLDRLGGEWADADHAPDLFALPSTTDWRTLAIDADNTFRAETAQDRHVLYPRLEFDNKKWGFLLKPDFVFANERRSDTRAVQEDVSRRFVLISPSARVSYSYKPFKPQKESDRGRLSLTYKLSHDAPSISYFLDVRDASDPLHISLGNPDLHDSFTHSLQLGQSYYGGVRTIRSSFSYNRRQQQVAQAMSYNAATGVYTYRPENVNGNWDLGGQLNMRFTPRDIPFVFSTSTYLGYNNSVDLISPDGIQNAAKSVVHNTSGNQSFEVTYSKAKYTANLEVRAGFEHATSDRPNFNDRTTYDMKYIGSFTANQFWKDFSFSTSLAFRQLRGYDDPSMNENTLVWDAQLSRSFGKSKAWNLRLKGHDLLHQLSNVRRTLNAQGITETWTNSLPSYVMLHVSYRWNKNPKK